MNEENIDEQFIPADISEPKSTSYIFEKLKRKDENEIPIPWCQWETKINDLSLIKYFTTVVPKHGYQTGMSVWKQVTVYEDLSFDFRVIYRPLHFTKLGMEEFKEARFETIGQLDQILRHADNLVTCRGCDTSPNTKPTSVSFRDNKGLLRHLKCPLIITDGTQCVSCKHVMKTLSKRKQPPENERTAKRMRLDKLPVKVKKYIDKILKDKQDAIKREKRKSTYIEKLKRKFEKLQREITKTKEKVFDGAMNNKNLSQNQRMTIREIVSCSKVKSRQGRRYSGEWLLSCILFHIRSPRGYSYVRDNKILPLPHISTIRL